MTSLTIGLVFALVALSVSISRIGDTSEGAGMVTACFAWVALVATLGRLLYLGHV